MTKIAPDNPYSPPSNLIVVTSHDVSLVAYLGCIVWFLPGTIVGSLLARCFQYGMANSLSSIQTVYSAIYLLTFAFCCLLSTLLWRLPRRYFAREARINSVAVFFSGVLMTLSATLAVWYGVESGMLPMKQWVHNGILLLCGLLAVECEIILSRSLSKRRVQETGESK